MQHRIASVAHFSNVPAFTSRQSAMFLPMATCCLSCGKKVRESCDTAGAIVVVLATCCPRDEDDDAVDLGLATTSRSPRSSDVKRPSSSSDCANSAPSGNNRCSELCRSFLVLPNFLMALSSITAALLRGMPGSMVEVGPLTSGCTCPSNNHPNKDLPEGLEAIAALRTRSRLPQASRQLRSSCDHSSRLRWQPNEGSWNDDGTNEHNPPCIN
mmetsp:Transcript_54162/g.107835  ORF Transcript_54162/g.107835 Transcript_54162/m.107835 type:complete len:213 (-) Transcript_54162:75-713(-)